MAIRTNSRRSDIPYNPAEVAYDQKECVICWDPFQNSNQITLLACKHIFHKECIVNLHNCPLDQSEIATPEEYAIPTGMDSLAFIQQLSSLDINQAAAEYNDLVKRHTKNLNRLFAENDLMTANTCFAFQPLPEMENHPRFPAILRRANEIFIAQKTRGYNRANCLQKPFYAYSATFGSEGVRVKELYENLDYSSPELNQLRRDYKRASCLIKRTIVVSSVALLFYLSHALSWR